MDMKLKIKNILRENIQQADKIYFNTGKLSADDRARLLSITKGDNYTKLCADLMKYLTNDNRKVNDGILRVVADMHKSMLTYDKNVFPLKHSLTDYSEEKNTPLHISNLYSCLRYRQEAVNSLRKLPSIGIRNLKDIIRTPTDNEYEIKNNADKISRLASFLGVLPKNDEKRNLVLKKIFSSANNTIDKMIDVAEHFSHMSTGNQEEVSREEVIDTVKQVEAKIVQAKPKLLVIKVNSNEAMIELACTSFWCFARPNSEQFWEDYADMGYVYIIYDFTKEVDDATFLMTYLPNGEVYAATNVPLSEIGISDEDGYLESIGVDLNKLKVKPVTYQSNKRKVGDPNQLSLALEASINIKNKLRGLY